MEDYDFIRDDAVFGTLIYDLSWTGYRRESFCGKESRIALIVSGEESGTFEPGQYAAYQGLVERWEDLQRAVLSGILRYYCDLRQQLGYDKEPNDDYPGMETEQDLLPHISLTGIHVPYENMYGGRSIGLLFDCDWNEENGVGVRLRDEGILEIGCQDIAL